MTTKTKLPRAAGGIRISELAGRGRNGKRLHSDDDQRDKAPLDLSGVRPRPRLRVRGDGHVGHAAAASSARSCSTRSSGWSAAS